jgi:murein L,D-transpeptidase YafK
MWRHLPRLFIGVSILLGLPRADASTSLSTYSSAAALPAASEVIVHKAKRRLELWQGNKLLRSYRISLGLNPQGHKQREGDFRTPEGRYVLDVRNPRSDFFLSMRVSYPNSSDIARARKAGVPPGGQIMIHGLPNEPRWPPEHYARENWTDGCIALNNADMMEVWMLVADGTPIDIRP